MTKRSPFRYVKTSLEIIRVAVMMLVRLPISLRGAISAQVHRLPMPENRD
jgi:hypothetical protein